MKITNRIYAALELVLERTKDAQAASLVLSESIYPPGEELYALINTKNVAFEKMEEAYAILDACVNDMITDEIKARENR